MPPPPVRIATKRLFTTLGLSALIFSSCAQAVEPRWATSEPIGRVEVHDSPREVLVVDSAPDIGELRFDGVVRVATSTPVLASEDGRIVETLLTTGDRVRRGEAVLSFQPAQTRASELEREVLIAQRELALERGVDEEIALANDAIATFDDSVRGTAVAVSSPVDGVVLDLADGLTRAGDEGDELFAVATSSDLIVTVTTTAERAEGIAVGSAVRTRSAAVGSRAVPGVVSAIDVSADSDQTLLTIEPNEALDASELSQSIDIEVDLTAADAAGDVVWVERRAVHRRDGNSFLLAEDSDGQLQRLDVSFGRRTETHVEVRETTNARLLVPGAVLVLP